MFVLPATSALSQAFADAINDICAMLGLYAGRLRDRSVLLSLIHWRVARMLRRLDQLAGHWQAGTLPMPRPRAATPRPNRKPQPRLPSGRHWLVRALQPTAQFIPHIEAFLARPDTRAFVEGVPQAGRILRPLCRGYGIAPPPWLALPEPTPRPPRVRSTPTAPATWPPPTPFRPLPANIRAAARTWKKYDR